MVLDLRLSKDWDVEMTSFLFFHSPLLFELHRSALEQASASGPLFGALGPPAGLLAATRARVCDGNAMSV